MYKTKARDFVKKNDEAKSTTYNSVPTCFLLLRSLS